MTGVLIGETKHYYHLVSTELVMQTCFYLAILFAVKQGEVVKAQHTYCGGIHSNISHVHVTSGNFGVKGV